MRAVSAIQTQADNSRPTSGPGAVPGAQDMAETLTFDTLCDDDLRPALAGDVLNPLALAQVISLKTG